MLGVRLKGTHLYAAEYDSTKAAIDTVEARIRNHKGRLDAICDRLAALEAKASYKKIDALERRINTLMGSITALEANAGEYDAEQSAEELWLNDHAYRKIHKRLTALEAHKHNVRVDAKCSCGRDIENAEVVWEIDGKQPPDTCEPKVDAAEKSVICPDCHGYGRDIFRKAVLEETCLTCHGMGKVNPVPDTCGNCKKAWRQDGYERVGCWQLGYWCSHGVDGMPCPHHERREA